MLLGKSTLKLLVLNDWHKTKFLSLTANFDLLVTKGQNRRKSSLHVYAVFYRNQVR